MNFRFTKVKTWTVIIIAALIGLYAFIVNPGINLDATTTFSQILTNKLIFFIFWFVLSFIPLYIIWSIFDTKKN